MTTFTTEDRENAWSTWPDDAWKNWNPNQQEIQFFWPLTEQIPLELDYTDCGVKPSTVYMSNNTSALFSTGTTFAINEPTTGWVTINSGRLDLDVEQTTILVKTKPPLYRRALYKLMGIDWKLK
jgi:hypothetical protein